jgi:hypothetical protein
MVQPYATRDAKRARRLLENLARLLENLARLLEHQHPDPAASLREGLEETLTRSLSEATPPNYYRRSHGNPPTRESFRADRDSQSVAASAV